MLEIRSCGRDVDLVVERCDHGGRFGNRLDFVASCRQEAHPAAGWVGEGHLPLPKSVPSSVDGPTIKSWTERLHDLGRNG